MLFLIEYDRSAGKTVLFRQYDEAERPAAQSARLERELAVNRAKVDHEVVLLEAPNLEMLRKTHRRYFGTKLTLDEFVENAIATIQVFADATRLRHQEDPDTFLLEREDRDWWNEVEAYSAVTDLEELLLQLRGGASPLRRDDH